MPETVPTRCSPWPHRLAVALALVTFPLIWVGGLVTTYDAGMAVPDWPSTYGYNLFRYPWQTWLAGPWDLFIEHGHRLLGAAAGMLAMALVAVVWMTDRRKWLVLASIVSLVLVIVQGILGGARVVFDERQVAMVHACVGPLYFAYVAFLVVATSRWWESVAYESSSAGSRFAYLAMMAPAVAYGQLVLGAILRHVPLSAGAGLFRAALVLHLIAAAVLFAVAALAVIRCWPLRGGHWRTSSALIMLFVAVQIVLGGGTYVMKYAFPTWMHGFSFAARYVVEEKSLAQSLVTTAHVATGSLILFVATLQATRAARCFFRASTSRDQTWSRTSPLATAACSAGRAAA